jgi:hypothetical protein
MHANHLSDTEFVDLIDGTLSVERMRHMAECSACRTKADELSAAIAATAVDDVPEPSPLFWEQFSQRVHTAIAREPQRFGTLSQLLQPAKARWAALAAAAVLMIAIGVRPMNKFHATPEPVGSTTAIMAQPEASADNDTFGDIEMDEAWALVRTFADELAPEEVNAAAVAEHPGSAEALVLHLSDRERKELAQLLEDEIERERRTEAAS